MSEANSFIRVEYAEPHPQRTRQILKKHPQINRLFGNQPLTAFFIVGIVALQCTIAYLLKDSAWWVIFLAAYSASAVANHALWTLIHDATHNLIFRKSAPNCLIQILANIPIIFPGAAINFRRYHILHHKYQGEIARDADLAGEFEARIIGNTFLGKAFWLLFFWVFQSLRVTRFRHIQLLDRWVVLNVITQILFIFSVVTFWGWGAFFYLFLGSVFAIGLHPLGARWIQEHFVVHEGQETYSYYGPLNKVAFNVGFHNEHHDFMQVPWNRLPRVRAIAPEFYNNLYYHMSWTRLFIRFLTDPKLSLYSRVTRPSPKKSKIMGVEGVRDHSPVLPMNEPVQSVHPAV